MTSKPQDVTILLKRWQQGDRIALDELIRLLSPQLRKSAVGIGQDSPQRHLFQPTELVNEALLRMLDISSIDWQDRAHFLAVAAITMRRVLVEQAREIHALKRARIDITLDDNILAKTNAPDLASLLDVESALNELHSLSPDRCRVVEMKFFAGMTNEEIAHVENISLSKVKRHWRVARAWIHDYLGKGT